MTQDTDDGVIDLPDPPLRTTTREGPLPQAAVIVYRINGTKSRGRLRALNATTKTLAVDTQQGPLKLSFPDIRHLFFPRHLPVSTASKPVPGTESPSATEVQSYRIRFNDGKTLAGKTRGHFLDQAGIHLFQVVDDAAVARLFIPHDNIGEYQIGPLLGESLVNAGKVDKGDLNRALQEQEKLRNKRLGDYLVANAAISATQLKQALEQQHTAFLDGQKSHTKAIGQYLLESGSITQADLDKALEQQRQDRSRKLGELLVENGAIDEKEVQLALARNLGIPFVELAKFDIEDEALAFVPGELAREHVIIPLCLHRGRLVVAMEDPMDRETIETVQFIAGRRLELTIATADDIYARLSEKYPEGAPLEEEAAAAEETQIQTLGDEHEDMETETVERLGHDKPIVRLVSRILLDAIRRKTSDIHVRPHEHEVELLFRIDGTLIPIKTFSKGLLTPIVSRIKIIGRMDIAEHRLPQDGRARITDGNTVVDLRISVMPTVSGESVVIRLLNTDAGLKTISQLGFNEHDGEIFTDMLHKSYGLILVTGPTGSGKSTTLYAALNEVIQQNVNIITVEDPVEYHIDGIEQVQVNAAQGYTFARALRNILRHDPDVIMIGEIRDQETAHIAVESALTGHLVLSTLHTNDAASAITRLLEMDVEPFLLNATVLGALAQRLVRRNCPHCLQEENVDPAIRKMLQISEDEVFYRGAGCDHCNGTGYSGRLAVYELLKLTAPIRAMVKEGASVDEIHELALKEGMTPLTENAMSQARRRTTSLAEVYRVRLE